MNSGKTAGLFLLLSALAMVASSAVVGFLRKFSGGVVQGYTVSAVLLLFFLLSALVFNRFLTIENRIVGFKRVDFIFFGFVAACGVFFVCLIFAIKVWSLPFSLEGVTFLDEGWGLFFLAMTLNALREEILYRFMLINIFKRTKSGIFCGVLISTLFFTLQHPQMTFHYIFSGGLLLGVVAVVSGSVWMSLGSHLAFNLLIAAFWTSSPLAHPAIFDIYWRKEFDFFSSVVYGLTAVAAIAYFLVTMSFRDINYHASRPDAMNHGHA